MSNRFLQRVLPLAVALVPATAYAGDEPPRASLEIDASALGEAGDALSERLRSRGEAVLRGADVLPGRGDADPIIHIVVEPLGNTPEAGYRSRYELRDGEETVEGTSGTAECRLCTQGELVQQIEAAVGRMVPLLPTGDEAPPPPEPVEPPPPTKQPVDRPRMAPLGKAGIALMVLGAAGLGTGIGLVLNKPEVLEDEPTKWRTTKTPGIAVAASGGAVLVTGMFMLVGERVRTTRRTRDLSWVPAIGPRDAAIVLRGRF